MRSILVWLLSLGGLGACVAEPFLVPDRGATLASGSSSVAFSEVAKVRVFVNGDAWHGDPPSLAEFMTPVQLTIENQSDQHVRLAYSDFSLIGSSGFRYPALSPMSVKVPVSQAPAGDATVALVAHHPLGPVPVSRFHHHRFLIAPHFLYLYPGFLGWSFGFPYDPRYYDRSVRAWGPDLPSLDMVAEALPEGVVENGGSVSGFIYFESIAREARVRFEMKVVNATSGESMGTVSIPFAVTRR